MALVGRRFQRQGDTPRTARLEYPGLEIQCVTPLRDRRRPFGSGRTTRALGGPARLGFCCGLALWHGRLSGICTQLTSPKRQGIGDSSSLVWAYSDAPASRLSRDGPPRGCSLARWRRDPQVSRFLPYGYQAQKPRRCSRITKRGKSSWPRESRPPQRVVTSRKPQPRPRGRKRSATFRPRHGRRLESQGAKVAHQGH